MEEFYHETGVPSTFLGSNDKGLTAKALILLPGKWICATILLDHFDARAMARSGSNFAVTRNQRSVERFCQRHVKRVVGGQVVTQFPNPPQKQDVWVTTNPKIHQVL